MDDIEERHKKEKKDLQAKIQQIKHAIPKGDKKRHKDAKAEIARLEDELQDRHEKEMKDHRAQSSVKECSEGVDNMSLSISDQRTEDLNVQSGDELPHQKKSKAAKRREKKEREDKEREARIALGMADSVNHVRNIEQKMLESKLKERNLQLFDIPSDGDCLYKAIAHQISLQTGQPQMSVKEVRGKTAEQMRKSPDEYLPYITTIEGDLIDESGYQAYVDKVENSHEWGGHVEINAMTAALGYPVQIIQASSSDINIECSSSKAHKPLRIVYHRHLYELGEHYNSVTETKS